MPAVKSPCPTGPTVSGMCGGAVADLIDLPVQAKQPHWNLIGSRLRPLHPRLDHESGLHEENHRGQREPA
jgi:hypothetical protein